MFLYSLPTALRQREKGWVFGLGQRLFITNQADHEYPLLDLRTVEFEVKR